MQKHTKHAHAYIEIIISSKNKTKQQIARDPRARGGLRVSLGWLSIQSYPNRIQSYPGGSNHILEYPIISWSIQSYPGGSNHILDYPIKSWRIQSYPGGSNHILEDPIISWRIQSYPGVSNHILEYPIISWSIQSYSGGSNHILEDPIISWKDPIISWRIQSYPGVSNHILEDPIIFWRIQSYSGGSNHILEDPIISWRIQSYSGGSNHILEDPIISWRIQSYPGGSNHILEDPIISWKIQSYPGVSNHILEPIYPEYPSYPGDPMMSEDPMDPGGSCHLEYAISWEDLIIFWRIQSCILSMWIISWSTDHILEDPIKVSNFPVLDPIQTLASKKQQLPYHWKHNLKKIEGIPLQKYPIPIRSSNPWLYIPFVVLIHLVYIALFWFVDPSGSKLQDTPIKSHVLYIS